MDILSRAIGEKLTARLGQQIVVDVSLFPKLGYDPVEDFAPITLTATLPMALVVNPSLPVKPVSELITLARARPGEINFATASSGGPTHMSAVLLQIMAGIDIVHIPYNGNAPALNDVMAGRRQMMFSNLLTSTPEEAAALIRSEIPKWREVVKKPGARPG